jgi:hypothetical protein
MSLEISTPCKMEHSLTGGLSNGSGDFYSMENGIESHRPAKQ